MTDNAKAPIDNVVPLHASRAGDAISSAYVFRTAAAPLRPGSLTVQVPRATGGTQNVTAGIDGTISASGVIGTVDFETGLVRLGFGSLFVDNALAHLSDTVADRVRAETGAAICGSFLQGQML